MIGRLLIVCTLFISTCNNSKKNENETISINERNKDADELEKEIKNKGSIEAYQDFSVAYIDDNQFGDFIAMAKIMANKYHYLPAYYDVFISIYNKQGMSVGIDTSINDFSLEHLNKMDRDTALWYLVKGANNGEKQSKFVLGKYYLKAQKIRNIIKKCAFC